MGLRRRYRVGIAPPFCVSEASGNHESAGRLFLAPDDRVVFCLPSNFFDANFSIDPNKGHRLINGVQGALLQGQPMIGKMKHAGLGPAGRVIFTGVKLKRTL